MHHSYGKASEQRRPSMVKNKYINKIVYIYIYTHTHTHTYINHTAGQDFPGGPVVENQSFKAEDVSSIPGQGN